MERDAQYRLEAAPAQTRSLPVVQIHYMSTHQFLQEESIHAGWRLLPSVWGQIEICLLKLRLTLAKSRDVKGIRRVKIEIYGTNITSLTLSNNVLVFLVEESRRAVMSLEDGALLI
jgi:hypothetical protein